MTKPITLLDVTDAAHRCSSASQFRAQYSYLYRIAQEKGWLDDLRYAGVNTITLSNGWKIPNPPNNFVFNLRNNCVSKS